MNIKNSMIEMIWLLSAFNEDNNLNRKIRQEVNKRKCFKCGKEFIPKRAKHHLCDDCFTKPA